MSRVWDSGLSLHGFKGKRVQVQGLNRVDSN